MSVGLVDKSPHGGWLLTYLMRFLSSSTVIWFAVFVFWGLPLFWLSLLLERLSGPKQVPLWSRLCWQLPVFQTERDEVLGPVTPGRREEQRAGWTFATEPPVHLTARLKFLSFRLTVLLSCIVPLM